MLDVGLYIFYMFLRGVHSYTLIYNIISHCTFLLFLLPGGPNEFQEYAKAYYNMESTFTSPDMRKIAVENKNTKEEMDEELKQVRYSWAMYQMAFH